MRTTTFSSLALLATSLLAREVIAGRFDVRKRDMIVATVTDEVIVTEEVTVTMEADGSLATGLPQPIGTTTVPGQVVLAVPSEAVPAAVPSTTAAVASVIVTPTPSSIPTVVAEPASSSSASESDGGIFIQQSPTSIAFSTPAPAPTTTAPAVIIPATSAPAVVLTPTTMATIVSSAAPVASTIPITSSSSKRGLAYNDADLLSGFVSSSSKVSWAYNWGSSTSGLPSGLEYVPMLWGLGSGKTSGWAADAKAAIAAGTTHLMSFNEPDLAAQSNIGYADAAAGYLTYMEPFAGQAKLGAPAVTNGGSPMGLTYLGNFLESCSKCTIDFVSIHWYDSATNIGYFKNYIQSAYTAGGNRPIWITEFGASGSADQQNTFLETVIPWLDSLDYVERYAYFMAADGILLSGGSTLSTLGNTYATFE